MTLDRHEGCVPSAPATIPYATPSSRAGSPTAAAAVIAAIGVALILLGGCFLIGVLACVSGAADPNAGRAFLVGVLYILAFGCFAGAGWLLFVAVARLIRITRS